MQLKKVADKIKNFFYKIGKFLLFLSALGLLGGAFQWWNKPVIHIHISEFYPGTLMENVFRKKPGEPGSEALSIQEFMVKGLKKFGSLSIKMRNGGRTTAKNISFNFLPQKCTVGKPSIWKTNADCEVKITPSTNLKMLFPKGAHVNISPEDIPASRRGFFVQIPKLRRGSEVKLTYTIYKESEDIEPNFKFSKILCENGDVKIF